MEEGQGMSHGSLFPCHCSWPYRKALLGGSPALPLGLHMLWPWTLEFPYSPEEFCGRLMWRRKTGVEQWAARRAYGVFME